MRIAMLTNNYKPYIGGVPISIEHLADALRQLGHTIYIFAPSYPNQEEELFVVRYPSFPIKIAQAPIPNVMTSIFRKMIQTLEIDLIHVHHPALVGNVAYMLRRQFGIPVVFTYHTRYEEYLYYLKALKVLENSTGMIDKYLRYFCNHCDMIFAPTPEIRDHLLYQKEITVPIKVLPTGLSYDHFDTHPHAAASIRAQYGSDVDYLFCTVARLAKEKNLDFILYALQRVKEHLTACNKTFRFLIIGDGLERENLETQCQHLGLDKDVLFLGTIENRRIRHYLGACDLFLFSSTSETQGIVVLEAMSAGIPVVAVEATGVRDLVWTGKNGILTQENPAQFAQAITKVLCHPAEYQTLCEGATKTASDYSEEKIASLAEKYYMELLNSYQNQSMHAILKAN